MLFRKYHINRAETGNALVEIIASRLAVSRKKAKQLVDSRNVFVNGQRVWMARHQVVAGDVVELPGAPLGSSAAPFKVSVLFKDEKILIADKPPGILTDGAGSIESLLRRSENKKNLRAAHRLDRNTSGCVLFALDEKTREAIIEIFRAHRITKVYHAIAEGLIREKEMILREKINNKTAESMMRKLDANRNGTHLSVSIKTGRTHQIRKHLNGIGHPVFGDALYFAPGRRSLPAIRVPRQMLHASKIIFEHPCSGETIKSESPLPPDFLECLKALRLT